MPLDRTPSDVFSSLAGACDAWSAALDAALLPAAEWLGHPTGMVKMAAGLVAAVFCGAMLHVTPNATSRHLLSALSGCLLVVTLFGAGGLNLLVSVVFAWVAMRCCRRRAGIAVFLGTFAYLLYLHVSNASGVAWREGRTDHTGAQMVVALKLISAAFNYADGEAAEPLTDFQRSRALVALPRPLAFAGYALNPTALLAAPGPEMSVYLDWAHSKGPWLRAPSPLLPSLWALLQAVVYFILFVALTPALPATAMYADDAWAAQPLWRRMGWLFAFMAVLRCKFYVTWKLAEAAVDASGLGFTGFNEDGRPVWERGTNVRPLQFELATSAVLLPAYWNIQTSQFFRHYVYERVAGRNQKPTFFALLITQVLSGVWHGLYAGYALFFVFSAFMIHASKGAYKLQQQFSGPALAFGSAAIHWLLVRMQISFLAEAFVLLEWHLCRKAWGRMQYIGLLVTACMLATSVAPAGLQHVKPKRR
mmetsp:Transcript_95556/g.270316  ORF Transcript_95556/g.270316 Transcript_95556/m.270316 type:complete len:477 (+) Transcript_95556:64-1494(+)